MNDAHLIESTIAEETVFKGRLLHINKDRVKLPNGAEATREYVKHAGAVVIIAVLPNGSLIFERQYRYPLREVVWELPAGKIDAGEDILATAQRELLEETGYTSDKWRHVGKTHPCVGYSDEAIEIFMAHNVKQENPQNLDEGEFLELHTLSLEEAFNKIRAGEITDAKTIAALFWVEKIQKEGW